MAQPKYKPAFFRCFGQVRVVRAVKLPIDGHLIHNSGTFSICCARFWLNGKESMNRNWEKMRDFERAYRSSTPVNIAENFRMANELLAEAQRLKVIPLADPLEGLEDKIKMVKILNAIRKTT
jgi:hypothetical protein